MNEKKVSVVIPTYNRADFLSQAIQSVLNQTYKNLELLIVDDGSTDNTKEIVENFIKTDQRIKYFYEENSGAPARPKNVGIKNSNGEYIAFLDSDDIWLPEKLEKQIEILIKNNNIGLISCEAFIINKTENIIDKHSINPVPKHGVFPEILKDDFMFSCSSIIIPKTVFEKIGLRDESPEIGNAEDREYELRIAKNGYDFYIIHEPLFKYRVHGKNITITGKGNIIPYGIVNNKYMEFYKKYNQQWRVFHQLGIGFLRDNNIKQSKKYLKLAFLNNKHNVKIALALFLSYLGEPGSKMLILLSNFANNFRFYLGKIKKWQKEMSS